mmetsp:Transcript_7332/g.13577  ORF Transcript_7332/g.13577 Transcript_7332/m.13577 type:complete len:299 (-) Transcript_7332:764-1660(-)
MIPCGTSQLLEDYNRNMTYLTSMTDRNLGSQVSASNAVKCKGLLLNYIKSTLNDKLLAAVCDDPECKSKNSRNESYLVNTPRVITVNLSWSTNLPKPSDILKVLAAIPLQFDVADIFRTDSNLYTIYGFIVFGLGHYMGVFYNESSGEWILHDDSVQRVVGTRGNFIEMINTCLSSTFYPVLVLYRHATDEELFDCSIQDIEWVILEKVAATHDLNYEENMQLMQSIEESMKKRSQVSSYVSSPPSQASTKESERSHASDSETNLKCSICQAELNAEEILSFVKDEISKASYCQLCKS